METIKLIAKAKQCDGTKIFTRLNRTLLTVVLLLFTAVPAFSHCDSYDGPVVKDAIKALQTNNVNLVLKWINSDQEKEIIPLFQKTQSLISGDKEIYTIVEKHFLETLVRLHRETEGAPYTGLKPAGTTKKIILLSDHAVEDKNINALLTKLNGHISEVVKEKYDRVSALEKVKDETIEKGREYVAAYIDYTHTLEALHDILENTNEHSAHLH